MHFTVDKTSISKLTASLPLFLILIVITASYSLLYLALAQIYNGIGPDAFPEWLRKGVSALHPSLAAVAFIHDIEWHESDGSKEKFTASNDRFKRNGYRVAKAQFGWYNPRRWIVMNQARRFGNVCQLFGWSAWTSPCECAVCRKKKEGAK